MPRVLPLQHRTAGVDLGANQGHAGGLTVPRDALLERPKKKVYTNAKGSGQYLGRIRTYNKIRRSAPLSDADHGRADGDTGPVCVLCAYGHLQAGQPLATGRGPAADGAVTPPPLGAVA